jgi:hypothetical protein
MSWQDAKADAEIQVARTLQLIADQLRKAPPGTKSPHSIRVAVYPSAYAYRYFKPDEPWSWEYHCAVMQAFQRRMKREGIRVDLWEVEPASFEFWLSKQANMPDGPAARAAYVGMMPD